MSEELSPSVKNPERQFFNRESRTPEEKLLLEGDISSAQPFADEKRVWEAKIAGFGKVLLKNYTYSDVNCEAAAFVVSDALDFNLVPKTVVRTIDDQIFSVQEFIPNATPMDENDQNKHPAQFYLLWLFDHIIRSNDRDVFNILFKDSQLIAIDHEAAFYSLEQETHHDTHQSFYGKPCPPNVLQLFEKILAEREKVEKDLQKSLSGLLPKEDIEKTLRRIFFIAELLQNHQQINSLEDLKNPTQEKDLFEKYQNLSHDQINKILEITQVERDKSKQYGLELTSEEIIEEKIAILSIFNRRITEVLGRETKFDSRKYETLLSELIREAFHLLKDTAVKYHQFFSAKGEVATKYIIHIQMIVISVFRYLVDGE